MFKLYCCGSRGSRPVEGRRFNEFGGFTSCYILKTDDYALIIDCGTGFYEANAIVCDCTKIDIVLTHVHYDHILGMLDWTAIPKTSVVNFYANFDDWFGSETMKEFFRKPFWPVQPDFNIHQCPKDGIPLVLRNDLSVEFYSSPHPNGAKLLMIRQKEISDKNSKFVKEYKLSIMFDCERSDGLSEDLIRNSDLLIYDGMYTDEEYPSKIGYGHSTWEEGCRLAQKVNCKRLIITHHSPNRDDDTLRSYEERARNEFYPNTDFARAGQTWTVGIQSHKSDSLLRRVNDKIDDNARKGKRVAKDISKTKNKIREKWKQITNIIIDEAKMRRFMSYVTYIALSVVSLVMAIVNYFTGYKSLMISTLIFSILSSIIYLFSKFAKKTEKVMGVLYQIAFIVLFTFFVITGNPEGFSIIWILLLPTMGMLVFGKKSATVSSLVMLLILIFFFWTPIGRSLIVVDELGELPYSESTMLRFPIAFIAFFAVGYLLETLRHYGFAKLDSMKIELDNKVADQLSELRDQNFELVKVNSQLDLRNRLLNNTFGRFMPDKIVGELLDNPNTSEIEGKKMIVTALQCDIRGFTHICQTMEALDIVGMINHYFSEMTGIIQKNHGTILDFVGDAILVVFGAPIPLANQADEAINTAIEMQKAMRRINEWNIANYYPELEVGIGVHTGEVVLGTVGSQRHMKYDAMGNAVNITSRIESVAKGGEILTTKDTLEACKIQFKILDEHQVNLKGIDKPVELYEIDY